MKGTTFEINGVHIYSMTNYYFIVKTEEIDTITSVLNHDLLGHLSDKIDPSLLEVAHNVSDIISSTTVA
ncbi:hypothetical protein LZP73_13005 [Shewanella sp. AS16]|uniref:hypothetical protein n=1 Tax=Shewanella sp. AS16 TaxID=2907625 RepID=UPI001F4587BD|nr:hypothetical protein [Shewanella sp. AS16]MCE9687110.1 hypothetical protein [Shewanella sp. AS16]